LGANSLVSCIYAGMLAGPAAVKYSRGLETGCDSVAPAIFERERVRQQDITDALLNQHKGTENPLTIWREMGDIMTENVTVIRYNANLEKTLVKLDELSERFTRINLQDRTQWANQTLNFVRELGNMLILARVITMGALARNETRGAHYKPEFPDRDDANWLKTTKASYTGGKIALEYEAVDTSQLPLRERKYTAKA
jgi:succinate dehydrogenase / fumarate reductase flavoprotein subunit